MAKFDMAAHFDAYLKALRKTPIDEKTEHTDRGALKVVLDDFAAEFAKGVVVQHEPRRTINKGAPDFKVAKAGSILGYVENKAIGEKLDVVLKSDQIKRYRSLSENILLTDYLHWIWIHGTSIQRETLCYPTDLENPRYRIKPDKAAAVGQLIKNFLSIAPVGIGRAHDLALALAARSQLLRDFLDVELRRQEKEHQEGRLYGLYLVFKAQVFHELSLAEFADAFAQMLAYGLFLARLSSGKDPVTLANAKAFVPGSFALIRELVQFVEDLQGGDYVEIRWVVDEVLSIVNGLDLGAIHEDLSFRHRKAISRKIRARDDEEHRLFERDPFIYFYEDFLGKYDAKMKKARGVYYTPPPVVNFIVRAIDDTLKDTFGIKQGLAEHKRVTVLDFACGTGTFLIEVLERIFDNTGGPDSGKAATLVREHIQKNVFGFEYLLAPYTIAHLKLSQYLTDRGHPLGANERLQVFLTNTLEPIEPQKNFMLPALSNETEQAQRVKDQPILVITGNPPYAGHSKNKGAWITGSIEEYRKGFPELYKPGQAKWLQDDYVKFIRFAQMKMDAVEEGVVGIITNHSWLDNPTFPGMRQSLMKTFNQIYVLDLHGSTKKKERAPDGGEDKNVFDIEQGVAISLLVKRKGLRSGVYHADLWGSRLGKYQFVAEATKEAIQWNKLNPTGPEFLFTPQNIELADVYREFWSVPQIFSLNGDPAPGIVTTHDQFAISFSQSEARSKVAQFLKTRTEKEARAIFRLCSQDQWSYTDAKDELPLIDLKRSAVPVLYRPFDIRWTIWNSNVAVHRRERAMRHMLKGNIGLVTSRLTKGETFKHVQVTDRVIEAICMSPTTSNNGFLFPLYIFAPDKADRKHKADLFDDDPFEGKDRIENVAPKFREWLDEKYGFHFAPEDILGYIFAILHAPTYRSNYEGFLRKDFPRIPFPEKRKAFEDLKSLGWELAEKHLLRDVPTLGLAVFQGKGNNVVVKPRYVEVEKAIYINDAQRFSPVPPDVWQFCVGGYQVLDKYLRSRKDETLALDEITNVENIANVLAFTIRQMTKIDVAYRSAFGG